MPKAAASSKKNSKTSAAPALPLSPTVVMGKRHVFTPRFDAFPLPDLIEVQKNSFEDFASKGIAETLMEISPISDFSGKRMELHFLKHRFEKPKITPEEAARKMGSYESNLMVKVRFVNKMTGEMKEQEIFLGVVPLMTDRGTFLVNGIERVVVNQIVRSPGAFFLRNAAVPGAFNAKIIPRRGAWVEIETDRKGMITAKIDRKRKMPITQLLRVFGFHTDADILDITKPLGLRPEDDLLLGTLEKDGIRELRDAYQSVYRRIRPGDMATPENAKNLIEGMFFDFKRYDMGVIARHKLGARFGTKISEKPKDRVMTKTDLANIVRELVRLNAEGGREDDVDHLENRRIRSVGELLQNKFRVGLLRTERIARDRMTVMESDAATATAIVNARPVTAAMHEFFASSQLSQFMDQTNPLAELAHKRRLSAMGPGGLSRERANFDVRDVHTSHYGRICPIATPEGPNIGLVMHLASYARVNRFGFVETPYQRVLHTAPNKAKETEGRMLDQDIAGVGKEGETITAAMAKKLATKKDIQEVRVRAYLSGEVEYSGASVEREMVVGQAPAQLSAKREFLEKRVPARRDGESTLVHVRDLSHVDVAPQQIISESTAMIPFLEHDDGTRAAMGSNMQRQAVPLISPAAPTVGTGVERVVSQSCGQSTVAPENGVVDSCDSTKLVFVGESGKRHTFAVPNFERTNQGTCFHSRALARPGQKVKKGDPLIDGASTASGEIALGNNLLVAYLSWAGQNFEDAIVISDRVVKRGMYDSIHIESYVIDVRETKLGPELVTRDIPNVSEARLGQLDADGIIRIGASVTEGDILVGKITPKGETELSPEERLLQAIFGEKAKDVKDSSLRLPGGGHGKVVDVQIFSREGGDELPMGVTKQIRVYVAQTRKLQVGDKMAGRHGNKGVVSRIVPAEDMPFLPDGTPVDIVLNPLGVSSRLNIGQVLEAHLGWAAEKLGITIAVPALDGLGTSHISDFLRQAGLPEDGKIQLRDGRTGEPFAHRSAVGYAHMLKLNHLVEDKIHARSVGPYSIVTQQPLGGKAQHGGQRFGEMEVWALEAYGAAHTLREMLTIKSDDVVGRSRAYESIVKGMPITAPSTPESFNVLVYELRALGVNVHLHSDGTAKEEEMDFDNMVEKNLETVGGVSADIPEGDRIAELDASNAETDEQLQAEADGDPGTAHTAEEELAEDVAGDDPVISPDNP